MFVEDNPDATLEDILEHHGIKGMKWGVHRNSGGGEGGGGKVGSKLKGTRPDASGVTRQQSRQQRSKDNRTTSRALEDWHLDTSRQQRNSDIKAARKAWKTDNRAYKDVKHDIKAQKKAGTMGKFQAKVALNQAANHRFETYHKSQQHTTGEAITHGVLNVLGAAVHP